MSLADEVIKSLGGEPHKEACSKKKKKRSTNKKKKGKKNEASSFGTYSFTNWKTGKPDPSALYDKLDKLGYEFGTDYSYEPKDKGSITIDNKKMSVDKKVVAILTKFFKGK